MSELITNIDLNEVINQYELEQVEMKPTKKIQFDTKNYLQARLGKDEMSKKLTIRLLPFSPNGGTPFEKVHMHTVKVNKEVSPSGWKTFVCPTHNKNENGEPMGTSCPFCDLSAKAKELKFSESDEHTKKKYEEIEFMNRVRDMWIVRCIERGHEEDGPKFWLFSSSKKKEGVYDKIYNLLVIRNEESKANTGKEYSILDVNDGRDLNITLTKTSDGKTSIFITDAGFNTPLSKDYDEAMGWINDQKKWNEVYTLKSYEYMEIVAKGGVPVYDKEQKKYVEKRAIEDEPDDVSVEVSKPLTDYSEISSSVEVGEINKDKFFDDLAF